MMHYNGHVPDVQPTKLTLIRPDPEATKSHMDLARSHIQDQQLSRAAEEFMLAEEFAKAAQMYETVFDYKNAIIAYVKAGQIQAAGDLLIRIGEKKKAARLFEKAKKVELAIKYYKETDSNEELLAMYEKSENFFEAFKIALRMHDVKLAEDYSFRIPRSDPNYVSAHILLMKESLEQKDFGKILNIFQTCFADAQIKITNENLTTCADVLEAAGHIKQTLNVYYMLLSQHVDEDNIQLKIKSLEKKFQKNHAFPALKTYHDRFQLHSKLGTGAMATVFKARDLTNGKWIALKTLSSKQKDGEILRAFLQEARTASRLNHPNITKVFDYGIENDHYFISMEYLEGKTLKDILFDVGQINIENFLSIAIPLTKALAYAHQNHTVHRDIKPANIMLLPNRSVKLMDFGISKITKFSDHKSIARGTPIYISPEQILGIQTTTQSDLYSLGVVFYEMISGHPPFIEGDILHDHIHKPAEELSKVVLDVPYPLINTIMSCLAKKADRRPTSAEKIIETLEAVQREMSGASKDSTEAS